MRARILPGLALSGFYGESLILYSGTGLNTSAMRGSSGPSMVLVPLGLGQRWIEFEGARYGPVAVHDAQHAKHR
jgi:hypothetical protein